MPENFEGENNFNSECLNKTASVTRQKMRRPMVIFNNYLQRYRTALYPGPAIRGMPFLTSRGKRHFLLRRIRRVSNRTDSMELHEYPIVELPGYLASRDLQIYWMQEHLLRWPHPTRFRLQAGPVYAHHQYFFPL